MLSKKLEKLLNDQIGHEFASSAYYLAIASWCDASNYEGNARFFYQHAAEETAHMMKIFHYVNNQGGHAIVPALKQPAASYKSLDQIFKLVLAHEKLITKSIYSLVEAAQQARDYGTLQFLQWFVTEQQEEENLVQSIMDKLSMIGVKDTRGLYLFDKYMAKLTMPR